MKDGFTSHHEQGGLAQNTENSVGVSELGLWPLTLAGRGGHHPDGFLVMNRLDDAYFTG